MKKAIKYLINSLAGLLFIVLMAVNVQVGNGDNILGLGISSIDKAKAGNCPVGEDPCGFYTFPDGTQIGEYGEVIVVTPEEE